MGRPMRACPQGSVSALPLLAKHTVSQQEEQGGTEINARGWGTGTDLLPVPTCPVWEVGAKLCQTGASTLGDGSSASPSGAMSSSLILLVVSVVPGMWSLWGTLPCWVNGWAWSNLHLARGDVPERIVGAQRRHSCHPARRGQGRLSGGSVPGLIIEG